MKRISSQTFGSITRKLFAAAAITIATGTVAAAHDYNVGLQKFLAEPTSFIAISEGAPGPVTFASLVGNTLLVQFKIPTQSGDAFGEIVGKVNASGEFKGNEVLISEGGKGRAAPVTMIFQDDGTIVATISGGQQGSGFLPKAVFYGY